MSIERGILLAAVLTSIGCEAALFGGEPAFDPSGNFGATPGGAQDIGFAREVIGNGQVPQPDTIMVEGLLSEHDLESSAESCDNLLCLQPDLGVAPDMVTDEQAYWIQIGMQSGLQRSTFRRPPLDVVVAIDKSSSMDIDMAETNAAVANMLEHLDEDDRISVVAFDDGVTDVVPLTAVVDKQGIERKVKALAASGGFDILGGAERAFAIARSAGSEPGRMRRVMFFACGTPDVGLAQNDAFSRMVKAAASEGIGTSFFGVLVGFSNPLSKMLGDTRGGAAYYLNDLAKVELVFDTDFEQMVTPVAYDLSIAIEPSADFVVDEVYGLPGSDAQSNHVATAFLSNRKGAIVARLRKTGAGDASSLGDVTFVYEPNAALGWSARTETVFSLPLPVDRSEVHYGGPGVRKTVALVNTAELMRAACHAFHLGDAAEATRLANRLVDYLEAEVEALDDDGLGRELALAKKLRDNILAD